MDEKCLPKMKDFDLKNIFRIITINNCYNVVVEDIHLTNSGSHGIDILSGKNIQIMDTSSMYNNLNGVNSATGEVVIQSCTFSYNGGDGVWNCQTLHYPIPSPPFHLAVRPPLYHAPVSHRRDKHKPE